MQVLGIFIGASFAEMTVLDGSSKETIFFHRWYLPRLGIRNQLQKIFLANPQLKPEKALVCSRFLEKIFDYRLGGSVAQLVTSGFEHWPYLSQKSSHQNIFKAQRSQPISSPELTFAINERIDAGGHILQPLDLAELNIILEKLKMMDVKKICLHFLHANKNPVHLNQTKSFFIEQGFEVFSPPTADQQDETALWRASTLNAATTGTFGELRRELEEGLATHLSADKIQFVDNQGQLFTNETEKRLGTLFGIESLWAQQVKNADILDLGLEKFSFIRPDQQHNIWQSHWGPVYLPHPERLELKLQPSSAIELNEWDELGFSSKSEGFEPGPMLFGRGQKPLFFDLYMNEISALCPEVNENIHPQGQQRFLSSLQALGRLTQKGRQHSPLEEAQHLRNKALTILAQQIHFLTTDRPLLLTGFFAPIFKADLEKKYPLLKMNMLLEKRPHKSEQIALKIIETENSRPSEVHP